MIVKPVRVHNGKVVTSGGKLFGQDVITNKLIKSKEDGGSDGLRYVVLKDAEKSGQLIELNYKSGKWIKHNPTETKKLLENATKKDFNVEFIEQRDPKNMFNQLTLLTKMVGRGIQPSLLVTGDAGTGKTFLIKETLVSMGFRESFEFVHYKGRATAAGLYTTLYEHSDKIIVLDDCDSVFKDDDAVNILKAALDSYDVRKISYITSKELKGEDGHPVPRHFEFKGRIIFISNIRQEKMDGAIKSRAFVADISMNKEQMFQRMEQLMDKMESGIPKAKKIQALEIMKQLDKEYSGVEVNLRSFIKAARICSMGFPNAKEMVAEQIIPA